MTGAPAREVYCWGDGLYGQTGTTERDVVIPRQVPGLEDMVAVALSDQHTCALTAAGDVYCWGENEFGQTGGQSAPEKTCVDYSHGREDVWPCQPMPQHVELPAPAARIAVSPARSCALLDTGKVTCWGDVAGIASFVAGVTDAVSVSTGDYGVCVTDRAHALSCSFDVHASPIPPLAGVTLAGAAAVGGGFFGCLLGDDGGVRCFGNNLWGQLGTGGLLDTGFPPTIAGATAVVAGGLHACALTGDGSVYCWGENSSGAVGLLPGASPYCGAFHCESVPQRVYGLPAVEEIAAGGETTCALTPPNSNADASDGRQLYCWGANTALADVNGRSRVMGPWEDGPIACEGQLTTILSQRAQAVADADKSCAGDGDCLAMAIDLGCDRSCAFTPVSRDAQPALAAAIVDLNDNRCPTVNGSCAAPEVPCPDRIPLPVCIEGRCVLRDAEGSGCDDACGCEAGLAAVTSYGNCDGVDLLPLVGLSCGECDGATSAVVVGNRGTEAFHGEVVISVERIAGDMETGELPDPIRVGLDIEAGAASQAIHLPSKGKGQGTLRVTAKGDCQPSNDASIDVDLPSPTSTTPCD